MSPKERGWVEARRTAGRDGRQLFRESEELARERIQRHRGLEIKGLGDGLMVAFQSARRAVACAHAIQRDG